MNPGIPQKTVRRKTLLIALAVLLLGVAWRAITMPVLEKVHPRARETVLKTNLRTLRDVIDQHYRDKRRYPTTLETLVEEGYLRKIPTDPITRSSNTWILVYEDGQPGIIDIKSGAPGNSLDGHPYEEW
jgi:general secretion pathway protein G